MGVGEGAKNGLLEAVRRSDAALSSVVADWVRGRYGGVGGGGGGEDKIGFREATDREGGGGNNMLREDGTRDKRETLTELENILKMWYVSSHFQDVVRVKQAFFSLQLGKRERGRGKVVLV